jgi:AraC-like DNA-binding protein
LKQISLAKSGTFIPPPEAPTTPDYRIAGKIRQQQRLLNEAEIAQLIAGYKAGSTVYQLAAQFGCHRTTVSRWLQSHGVRMRPMLLSDQQIEQATHLYQSGFSLVKIGQTIGCSPDMVRSRLRERGVVMRPKGRGKKSDVRIKALTSS